MFLISIGAHLNVKANVNYDYTWHFVNSAGVGIDTTATFFFDPLTALTGSDIPTRNKYLMNEANLNEANLDAAVAKMGGDAQDTRLWWQP